MHTEQDAARFFNVFAGTFDTLYDGKRNPVMRAIDRRFRSDMFIRFAMTFDVLGSLQDRTVLDIGCGSGPYVLEALKRRARHVTAVDPAPNMLELAGQRLAQAGQSDRCTLVNGYFPNVTLTPCDHAIVMGVMDYIEDPVPFLAALKPLVTRSAAVSFSSTHWARTPFRKFRYDLRRCPVFFYQEAQIRNISRAAGFRDVQVVKIPGAGMDYHVCLKP
jgi:cyclopropane fatty-acyl-phospholipid synthase-like methyltransferase